jgi:hypothetical protein
LWINAVLAVDIQSGKIDIKNHILLLLSLIIIVLMMRKKGRQNGDGYTVGGEMGMGKQCQ